MSRYETEKQMVQDAIATLPALFRLRAFPELTCRANPGASFVLNGSVQVVVDVRRTDADRWQQMGRDDIAVLRRELRPVTEGA